MARKLARVERDTCARDIRHVLGSSKQMTRGLVPLKKYIHVTFLFLGCLTRQTPGCCTKQFIKMGKEEWRHKIKR